MKRIEKIIIVIFVTISFFSAANEKYRECFREDKDNLINARAELYEAANDDDTLELPLLSKCLGNKTSFFWYGGTSAHDNGGILFGYMKIYSSKKMVKKSEFSKLMRYIVIMKGGKTTDVLKVPKKRTYSLWVNLKDDTMNGAVIGIWDKKKLYFKIEELYRITADGELVRLELNEADKITGFPYLNDLGNEIDGKGMNELKYGIK